MLKVQVKGASEAKFTAAGTSRQEVKPSTLNHWAAIRLPVIAVLVDLKTEAMYWTRPAPVFDEDKSELVFDAAQRFDEAPDEFRRTVRQLAQWPAASTVLDQVAYFVSVFVDFRYEHNVDHLDMNADLDLTALGLLELFYEHVLRLRGLVLGTSPVVILPFEMWRTRSHYLDERHFGGSSETGMLAAVASELLRYLEPLYREALDRCRALAQATSVIDAHPHFAGFAHGGGLEDARLDSLFATGESGEDSPLRTVRYHSPNPPVDAATGQRHLDQFLQEKGLHRLSLTG